MNSKEERDAGGKGALQAALHAWRGGAEMRARRRRYRDYTYGRQWADRVVSDQGKVMTEEEMAVRAGARPMTNNLIRQLVKCVTGNFRQSLRRGESTAEEGGDAGEQMTVAGGPDTAVKMRNELDELDSRMLEEFLISGCAIQRVVNESRMDGDGVWVDNVSPDRFFVNRFTDPRGHDIEIVGMLHDYSLRETMMRFGGGSIGRAAEIERIYSRVAEAGPEVSLGDSVGSDFFHSEAGRCRVIEVWTLESRSVIKCHDRQTGEVFVVSGGESGRIAKLNRRRRASGWGEVESSPRMTARWHCRMLAPTGDVLDEYDSPYVHGRHPFAIKFYPQTDGEVHSFVEDVIDQQRYINRLITLIDHIMSTSAKGVLLYPVDCKPDGWDWEDIYEVWARPSGVLPIKTTPNSKEPHQVISNAEHSGAYHLLDLQMQMLQQVSGISGALQGRIETSNSSAALYDAQVRNSAVAILDLLESFNSFRRSRDLLVAGV